MVVNVSWLSCSVTACAIADVKELLHHRDVTKAEKAAVEMK